jgi:hypothetical protein
MLFCCAMARVYTSGKSKWTQAHFLWLQRVKFALPVQQIVLEDYVDAIKQAASENQMKALLFTVWVFKHRLKDVSTSKPRQSGLAFRRAGDNHNH